MSLLNKSKQELYGEQTIKRIQKAAKPNIGDIGIGILQSIQSGLKERVKNNLERINTNFEDEELRLTNLYNDYSQTENLINELEKKGNGNLVTGIMYDKISKVKDTASVEGFRARVDGANPNDNFFVQLKNESEKEASILQQRLKELGTLRTSYDPDNIEEGILATGLKTEPQFKKPVRDAVKTISLNQKTKGSNNFLDEVMSTIGISSRGDYSMIDDFYEKEANIDKIIKSSLAARDALPIYSGDSELLKSYIENKTDAANNKGLNSPDKLKEDFPQLMADMREFVKLELGLEGNGSFYFMPKRDNDSKKLKDFTEEELTNFTNKYGYTKEDINRLYFNAEALGEEIFATNSNVLGRLEQSSPTMLLSADNDKKLSAIEARELYKKYDYDINKVPAEKRRLVVSLLELENEGISPIDDDVYLQTASIIQTKTNTLLNDNRQRLYNNLPSASKMTANYTIIAHADSLIQNTSLERDKAINVAINIQKLGLVTGKEYSELFGIFTEGDIKNKLPQEEFLAQPFVPYDTKEGRVVQPLLDYYPANKILSESRLEEITNQLNKTPIYFYEPKTITTNNPTMFETGTRYQVGQAVFTFSREADVNGNRWTRTK